MAIPVNLAMTAAEFCFCRSLPAQTAWMACHFSSGSDGASNLPQWLPPGSLLILDDQSPIHGHSRERIGVELASCVQNLDCQGVLLDFQRPGIGELEAMAAYLVEILPCPVAVTALYAQKDGAVLLPPLPCHISLEDWVSPWQNRETWLELSLDQEVITLSEKGPDIAPRMFEKAAGFTDEKLHCHYCVAVEKTEAVFHLWRTSEDLGRLLEDAEALGIQRTVGLYQELQNILCVR